MYKVKKEFDQLKPIIYPETTNQVDNSQLQLGVDNRLYRSLFRIFDAFWIYAKKELFLVGGCVRDLLLNRQPKDYDLTTNATPEEVKKICIALGLKTFDSGIKHGTITILDEFYGQSYEITTYRVDGKYTDGRHPDSVEFVSSLKEDLKRRDFTINSFAYDLLKQELLALDESYLKDLEFGIIRTVGDPAERYEEDALRMLRAIRFSAQLNFSIEKYTYSAIKMCAPLLAKVSKERIRDELTKIIMSDTPEVLELAAITRLEDYFGNFEHSYLACMLDCEHQNPWHYTDVFHHTLDVVKRVPKIFEVRWAALLHDIGKPYVKKLKEGTVDQYVYYGHPEKSAEIALTIMDTLKFSNDQKDLIYKFIKYHDDSLDTVKNSTFKRVVTDIGKENFPLFMKLRLADAMSHKLSQGTIYAVDAVSNVYDRFKEILDNDEAMTIKDLAINGNDILADGFLEGPEIGDCLKWMLNLVLEHPEYNNREKLLELLEIFKEMSFQSS